MGGLNATGRGQWRPIWQLFINHYENRMGNPDELLPDDERDYRNGAWRRFVWEQ